jgi:N-acetylglucosamine kinase-like BadF-type ATPase
MIGATSLVFGADGGGSKTLGVLADVSGPLARFDAGPSNPTVVGIEQSAATLRGLISNCCAAAGRKPEEIGLAVIGLAGVGTASIREALHAEIARLLAGSAPAAISLETDSRIALEGAFDGGEGAIVIAGTGSNVLGKDRAGVLHRAGGWGRILGDEGSGFDIGLRALKVLTQEIDGVSPPSEIGRALSDRFGWSSRDRIIANIYRENMQIASVAPVVVGLADAGDPGAAEILRSAAESLARQVAVVFRHLGPEPRAALVGGLVSTPPSYSLILAEALKARVKGLSIVPAMHPPVEGALRMALSLLTTRDAAPRA